MPPMMLDCVISRLLLVIFYLSYEIRGYAVPSTEAQSHVLLAVLTNDSNARANNIQIQMNIRLLVFSI